MTSPSNRESPSGRESNSCRSPCTVGSAPSGWSQPSRAFRCARPPRCRPLGLHYQSAAPHIRRRERSQERSESGRTPRPAHRSDKLRHPPGEATLLQELAEPFAAANLELVGVAAPFQIDRAHQRVPPSWPSSHSRPRRYFFSHTAKASGSGRRNVDCPSYFSHTTTAPPLREHVHQNFRVRRHDELGPLRRCHQ